MDAYYSPALEAAAAEIEAHVGQAGWDLRPSLFALVRADQFASEEPEAAARLGLGASVGEALTPIEQDDLPTGALDEMLAQIAWPDSVAGCALSQEIVLLPPSAEAEIPEILDGSSLAAVADHPDRREARLVVAVLRDGTSAAVLRLRSTSTAPQDADDLLTGPDLAPNLVRALRATLA
ncbi:MAG: PPA1309 family protein [Actinomycetota bacterium]|nr:PPA1309 family protein [Actinomycetota bacterium]